MQDTRKGHLQNRIGTLGSRFEQGDLLVVCDMRKGHLRARARIPVFQPVPCSYKAPHQRGIGETEPSRGLIEGPINVGSEKLSPLEGS